MQKITPTIWFDDAAEEAGSFYAGLLPGSRVEAVNRSPIETPSGPEGQVLTVIVTIAGQRFCLLNGGPIFPHSEAFSFQVSTETQEETDRYWNAIVGNGGTESACGWCKDKWGLNWQITPRVLIEATTSSDKGVAKRAFDAMMTMKKIDIAAIEAAVRGGAVGAA